MSSITVLIPSYNHGNYLVYQIESLLSQRLMPCNIYILDDGSTDETLQLLEKYSENKRVTIISKKINQGIHSSLNFLLDKVDTEFFAFAAADDILTRDWCLTMSNLLARYPDTKMAISNSFTWDAGLVSETQNISRLQGQNSGIYMPKDFINLLLKNGRFPPSNTIVYRSDIIKNIIKPLITREELSNIVDIFLILAIATKNPVAYTTMPLGVSIRNITGYGHSNFQGPQLQIVLDSIKKIGIFEGYLTDRKVLNFLNKTLKYNWIKMYALDKLRNNNDTYMGCNLKLHNFCVYLQLTFYFILNGRYKYIRLLRHPQESKLRLENSVNQNILKRFNLP